jgi:hypothetical protein
MRISGWFCPETGKTGHESGIPASIFKRFLDFFGWNRSVRFDLGIIVNTNVQRDSRL